MYNYELSLSLPVLIFPGAIYIISGWLFSQFSGPKNCAGVCFGEAADYEQCNAQNKTTACSMSHCFAGIGKWRENGTDKTGYMNGCIDCAGETMG